MKHEEFLQKYLGELNDYDELYGPQCIDLVKLYTRDVFGIFLGTFGNTAYNGWLNIASTFTSDRWERMEYEKGMTAQEGDIVFLAPTKSNKYGHVGIATPSTISTLRLLEQNAKSGTGKGLPGDEISIGEYKGYKGVVGWYRLRKPVENKKTKRVQREIQKLMKAVGISDVGMDEYITKRNVLTIITPLILSMARELEKLQNNQQHESFSDGSKEA